MRHAFWAEPFRSGLGITLPIDYLIGPALQLFIGVRSANVFGCKRDPIDTTVCQPRTGRAIPALSEQINIVHTAFLDLVQAIHQ